MPDQPPITPSQNANDGLPKPGRFHLLFMCLLVIGAGNSMLSALLPPLVRRLDLPDSSIGWIFSLSAVLWVLTSPYWGRLSDRTGRKPIIAFGLAAYAVSMGGFALMVTLGLAGWIHGFTLFLGLVLTRAIFGAFGSASSPAAQAYVADRTSLAQRTEELAALTAAFALGSALGPAIVSALAARVGLVVPLVLVAAMAAAASIAIWRLLPETQRPRETNAKRGGDFSESLKLARDPRIAAYLLFGFGLSVVTATLQQVFALFTMDRLGVEGREGAELAALGFMVSAMTLLATQMGLIPRIRLGSRTLMALGTALVAAGVLVQLWSDSLGLLMVSQVIQGMGFGLARPGFTGGASMAVRPDEQGPVAGLIVAMNGAGYIISPMTGGVAYESWGMYAPLVLSLIVIAPMFAFVLLSRRLRNRPTQNTTTLGEP